MSKMKAAAKRGERSSKSALLTRVVQTIREQGLFAAGQHLLVAVSGGPDSVALIALLANLAPSWRLKLTAVHFNYRLRGKESDGDEAFVSELCRRKKVPLLVRRPILLKRNKQSSLQALARDARYAAMKSIAHEIKADRIVVGHTANDQAETVLMWMLRGAGLTGLSGMPFIRESLIVRPLLAVTKSEVLAYLKQEGLRYRRDSSNDSVRYRRNRIRKELVPVLEQIAPATVRLLQRQANLLREDDHYLEQVVQTLQASIVKPDTTGGQRYDRDVFLAVPLALRRRLVRRMLRAADPEGRAFSANTVEAVQRFMLTAEQGARLSLKQLEFTHEGETIRIGRSAPERRALVQAAHGPLEFPVTIPSTVFWPRTKQYIHVQIMVREHAEPFLRKPSSTQAVFDADCFSAPLLLRSWRPGDRLYPSGMKGKSKKLQDLFTDWKVAILDRHAIPLLVAPEGILWVTGRRQDERFLVRADTARCLLVTVSE